MKRWFFLVIFACVCAPARLFAATRLPQVSSPPFVPGSFVSAIVVTPNAKQVLYEYQADLPHPAASLTKLPMALTFVKASNTPLTRKVSILKADEVGGGRLRVQSGAKMSVKDLLYSSITGSANNAATALIRLSGYKKDAFFTRVEREVARLGATQSHFVDASGMDPANMTTARDMAQIAAAAFSVPSIQRAAQASEYRFFVQEGKKTYQKSIKNTNHLLTERAHDDVWVMAGKTGYLEEANYNFVVRLRPVDVHGTSIPRQEVLVVVLGAPTKEGSFQAAKELAQWAWKSHAF